MKTAFVGLGVMGYPMAGYLAARGHEVVVYNRSTDKAERWLEQYQGSSAATPAEAADGADIVFCCVGNDDDVREVTLGEFGVVHAMSPGSILVDHTTASATLARELHAVASERQVGFLDAPLSGGQAGAENGQLTIMVGGDADVFERALPVMESYAKAVTLIGPAGSGQLAKMVNQICIAGLLQGLSEGLHFATRAGLDIEKVISAISKGAAQSWQMDHRWQTMVNGQFEFGFVCDFDTAFNRQGAPVPGGPGVAEVVAAWFVIGAAGHPERFAGDHRAKWRGRLTERGQNLGAVANGALFL